jgi:hypothetical protein
MQLAQCSLPVGLRLEAFQSAMIARHSEPFRSGIDANDRDQFHIL